MTSMIKVTSPDLHNVSTQLINGSSDIEAKLATLHAQVKGLVDSGWQGAASGAFDHLYDQWNTSAAQLKQALDGIGRQLAATATTYEQTEQQLTAQLGG